MLLLLLFLALSIGLLVKSSDYFVENSSNLAKKVGISDFVIGFTLVAFGTSFPELVSSVYASILDKSSIVVGNILGSNVANIALILGVGGILITIPVRKKTYYNDGMMLLFSTLLFALFLYTNKTISTIEGVILLVLFFSYTIWRIKSKSDNPSSSKKKHNKKGLLKDITYIILSGAGIYFGAKFTVDNAISIAQLLNVPESFIGFTIIALGTSLPELSVTISSARQNKVDLLLGNVVGSNIANMLIVGGICTLISPLSFTIFPTFIGMIFVTFMLLFFMRTKWKLEKFEGITFLVFYFSFMIWLTLQSL